MSDKKAILAGFLGGLLAVGVVCGLGAAWTVANFEGAAGIAGPITNATLASNIDDYIRNERQEIRYRAEVEHFWGEGDTLIDDNGLHRLGSARCYMTNAAPTEMSDSHTGVAGNTIDDYLNSVGTSFSGIYDGGLNDPASNSAAGAEDDIGHGRCWIDMDGPDNSAGTIDDYKMYIFQGVAGVAGAPSCTGYVAPGWCPADAADRPGGDDEILAGSHNLIYNGGFEATDGTGDDTSTTVPDGWTLVDAGGGNPTFVYTDPSNDALYGDGFHLEVTDVGGAGGDYIYQTVTTTGAKVYRVMARVSSDGVSTCRLASSGAALDTGNQDSVAAAWTTVTGTFTTAAPDSVQIRLITVTNAATCDWDHVNVYPVGDVAVDRPEISQPGTLVFYDTSSDAGTVCGAAYGAGACNDIVAVDVTPPTSGYVLMVRAGLTLNPDSLEGCGAQLHDGTSGVDTFEQVAGTRDRFLLRDFKVNPTPGVTLSYTVDGRELGLVGPGNCNTDGATTEHFIEAYLIPTR